MRGFKPPYPPEFRARVVELARAGRSLASLAKEYGVTDMSIPQAMPKATARYDTSGLRALIGPRSLASTGEPPLLQFYQ
jgi:transposase-like protein